MWSTHLVSKDLATSTSAVNLGIVKTSQLIESYLSICIQDEHWHKLVLFQVFD